MYSKEFTYESIANVSGLSIATISRVFNKSPLVREETRRKVIKAMAEIGMNPSDYDLQPLPADNLILFNVPTLKNPFYSPIISASIAAARRHGYTVVVNEFDIDKTGIEAFLRILKKTRAAGVIIVNSVDTKFLEAISSSIPAVICCDDETPSSIPFVTIDNRRAAEEAVRYLLSLGRKRIGFVNGPETFKYARSRAEGYQEALRKAGIPTDRNLVTSVGADMDFDTAKAACMHMLTLPDRPDAFFCISDVLAAAAIKAAFAYDLRVPEDVAVIGFDDILVSKMMNPTITTVRQPTLQIGTLAAEMLVKIIEGDESSQHSVCLDTELVIRESTRIV